MTVWFSIKRSPSDKGACEIACLLVASRAAQYRRLPTDARGEGVVIFDQGGGGGEGGNDDADLGPYLAACPAGNRIMAWQPLSGQRGQAGLEVLVRGSKHFLNQETSIEDSQAGLSLPFLRSAWFQPALIDSVLVVCDGAHFMLFHGRNRDAHLVKSRSVSSLEDAVSFRLGEIACEEQSSAFEKESVRIKLDLISVLSNELYKTDSIRESLMRRAAVAWKHSVIKEQSSSLVILRKDEQQVEQLKREGESFKRSARNLGSFTQETSQNIKLNFSALGDFLSPRAEACGKFRILHSEGPMRWNGAQIAIEGQTVDEVRGPRRRPKSRRDPNLPKCYMSAYNFWAKSNIESVRQKRAKDLESLGKKEKVNALNVIMGSLWQQLPAEQRKIYDDMADADKRRYLREMESYQPSEGLEKKRPKINDPDKDNSSANSDAKLCNNASSNVLKISQSGYTVFAHHERFAWQAQDKEECKCSSRCCRCTSNYLRRRWKTMPEAELMCYYDVDRSSNLKKY